MTTDAALARNEQLAERIACGRSPFTAEIETTLRQTAAAGLDVPGPRVMQLFAELDRWRTNSARIGAVANLLDWAEEAGLGYESAASSGIEELQLLGVTDAELTAANEKRRDGQ